ncbi:pyridoxal phosphate-dependent aminotransferase [Reichenbachiella ulvae]|nr:histidinol-phosphate transaminase [Reichenbachiella ulvae]
MKANRRDWLKTSLMTIGGMAIAPHLSYSETPRVSISPDANGDFQYSPFFKEFVPQIKIDRNLALARLMANENPYGPSPMGLEAFTKAAASGNRYAWSELFALIDKIAAKEGVTAENILMGPGSSDILEKVGMVFFLEGGNIVSADPSYMSMMKVAEAIGATWKGVPLKKDWSHDLKAMEKAIDADTKLVYICNPNNPTGSLTDFDELRDFCSRVSDRVPVFVDEAYLDFLDEPEKKSMVDLVARGKNVIVARTFSKIYGMAGLRVGYGVGLTETMARLSKITRGGMGISYPSVYAATAALDDSAFIKKSKDLNTETREYVCGELKKMGIKYVPSYTSFVIFPIEMDGQEYLSAMQAEGVLVRAFEFMGQKWCRVSMGTMDEMKQFVGAFKKVTA